MDDRRRRSSGPAPACRGRGRCRLGLFVGVAALSLAVAGCGSGDDAAEGTIPVVATTTQVADMVRAVGGDAVTVHQLLQPNSDPHDYEPRPADVESVAGADLVFASGEGLDEWIGEVVGDSGSGAEVVDLGAGVPVRLAGEGDEEHDPHWWHDPRNAEAAVGEIERALASADPSRRALFAKRAAAYERRLRALDAGIAACVETVPPPARRIVTDHDSLGYFANRYGIEVVGVVIPAQTTQAQPSAKDLSELARKIEEQRVRAIFPGSATSSRVAEAIADQTGVSAEHRLYGDTLGPEGSDGATYIEMEEANADSLLRGLTGDRRGCRIGA